MRSILKTALFAALLSHAGVAMAQQTTSENDLALGEATGPQLGETYERGVFGDWTLRCVRAEEGQADPCNLYQLLNNVDGVAVAEVSLFPLQDDGRAAAGATVVVPLETLLTQQLTLAVDGANPRRYPFSFCNQAGCVARVGFTQAEVDEFKAGSAATLRLVPAAAPEAEVLLELSLTGFTAGFDASVDAAAD